MPKKDEYLKSLKKLRRGEAKSFPRLKVSDKVTEYDYGFDELLEKVDDNTPKSEIRNILGPLLNNLELLDGMIDEGSKYDISSTTATRLVGHLTSLYAEEFCRNNDFFLIPHKWASLYGIFRSVGRIGDERFNIKGEKVGNDVFAYARNIEIQVIEAKYYLLNFAEYCKAKVVNCGNYAGYRGEHLYIEAEKADGSFLEGAKHSLGEAKQVGESAGLDCEECKLIVGEARDSFMRNARHSEAEADVAGSDCGTHVEDVRIKVREAGDYFLSHAHDSIGTAEKVGMFAGQNAIRTTLNLGVAGKHLLSEARDCQAYVKSFDGRAGEGSERCTINNVEIPSNGATAKDLGL